MTFLILVESVSCQWLASAASVGLANAGPYKGQMQLECAAFVSLVILVVNVGMKGVLFFVKKRANALA